MLKNVNRLLVFCNLAAAVVLITVVYLTWHSKSDISNIRAQNELRFSQFLDVKVARMSIEEKRGILFMVSIPDQELTSTTINYLRSNHIGAVILMRENIKSSAQLAKLTDDLKGKVDKRMIIAIDQEGGTVVRIDWDNYASVSARQLADKHDLKYTEQVTEYRSKLLLNLGINTILGPVCDISDSSSYMYSRSYGSSNTQVNEQIGVITKTQEDQGIISVPKHFPGHGKTSKDSHLEFPIINVQKDELIRNEFVPFKTSINNGADLIMLGHVVNPNIDTKPASISREYLTILENDLGFRGVVVTDDLKMTGKIDGGIGWGINLIIDSPQNVEKRIKTITPEDEYVRRILELKYEKL